MLRPVVWQFVQGQSGGFNWPTQGSFIKAPQEGRDSMALGGSRDTVPSPSASPTWNQEEIRDIFKCHRSAFDERSVWD
jgi:hypothetical protein